MVAVMTSTPSIESAVTLPPRASRRKRLLLVADDRAKRTEASEAEDLRGLDVCAVESTAAALRLAGTGWSPDIVVVDLLLPRLECYTIVRAMRSVFAVPVVLAVAGDAERAKDCAPADGIVRRPVDAPALLAVTRSVMQYERGSERSSVIGDLRIFPLSGRVLAGSRQIELSPDESRLLTLLVERAGRPVGRRELMSLLAGVSPDMDPRIVDVYVVRLMVQLSGWSTVSIERTPNRDAFVLNANPRAALLAGLA
jgi:two-component system OmpR family response regulator